MQPRQEGQQRAQKKSNRWLNLYLYDTSGGDANGAYTGGAERMGTPCNRGTSIRHPRCTTLARVQPLPCCLPLHSAATVSVATCAAVAAAG
jgi:hypothetical protein